MPDLASIMRLNTAYAEARLLHSAVEVGIFELLAAGPRTAEEICRARDLHPRLVRDFLDGLTALGLLEKREEAYGNSQAAGEYLVPGGPVFIGGRVRAAAQRHYRTWTGLTEALHDGKPKAALGLGAMDELYSDPAKARAFLVHMDANNAIVAPQLASVVGWSSYRSFVDIGGARGNVTAHLVEAFPHLSGGVFDLPKIEPYFTELVTERAVADRVTFHPGDFFTDPLPRADVLVLGHVLHDWAPEDRRMLLRKAFDAVPVGGAVVVYDQMLAEQHPDLASLLGSLNVALLSDGGSEYTVTELRDWLADAGFRFDSATRLAEGNDTVVVAHKN